MKAKNCWLLYLAELSIQETFAPGRRSPDSVTEHDSPHSDSLDEQTALSDSLSLITVSSYGKTAVETFSLVTISISSTLGSEISTYITNIFGSTNTALIGASGVGWEALNSPSNFPILFPTALPSAESSGSSGTTSGSQSNTKNMSSTSTSSSASSTISSPSWMGFLPTTVPTTATTSSALGGALLPLPFVTPRPETVSAVTSSIAGISTNAIVTVKKDSGPKVVVPFLFHCVIFCTAKDVGILLFGIGPDPGIYVLNPPPLPSLNVITIGHDNKPTPGTDKSEDPTKTYSTNDQKPTASTLSTTTSSSTCSQHTTIGCFTSCDSGTTMSCTTTCSTVFGCTATATNIATTSVCQMPNTSGFPFAFGPDGLMPLPVMNQSITASTSQGSSSVEPSTTLTGSATTSGTPTLRQAPSTGVPSPTSSPIPSTSMEPTPVYCLPNIMNDTLCTCTNNTVTAQDSTGNCPNALPSENPDQIFIWHYYYASDNNNDTNVYHVSQKMNASEPLLDLHQQAIFSSPTLDSIYGIPVELGPFNIEDNAHGACSYTGTAAGEGSVICGNDVTIKCYDLVGGDTAQSKPRSFLIELGRLLMVCSNLI